VENEGINVLRLKGGQVLSNLEQGSQLSLSANHMGIMLQC
jgi:hypothetical protein